MEGGTRGADAEITQRHLLQIGIAQRHFSLVDFNHPDVQPNKHKKRKLAMINALVRYLLEHNKRFMRFGDEDAPFFEMSDVEVLSKSLGMSLRHFNSNFVQLFETKKCRLSEQHKELLLKICEPFAEQISPYSSQSHERECRYQKELVWKLIQTEFSIATRLPFLFHRGYIKTHYLQLMKQRFGASQAKCPTDGSLQNPNSESAAPRARDAENQTGLL